jgi:hypothetical protein
MEALRSPETLITIYTYRATEDTEVPGGLSFLLASAGSLFNLHFDPENEDDIFLRNFGLSPICTALQAGRRHSS